jgi:hypothetical protein
MKNFMKFLVLMIVVFALATNSFAQKFGARAGFNLATALVKDNSDTYSDNFKMKPGFHIGATAEFPINETFAFETGLLLSSKGTKESESESGYEYTAVANLYYFDIPLTGKAYYELGGVKIYGLLGPYLGVGLSGKTKIQETGSSDYNETVEWGTDSENDDLKRLDMGLTFGAGVVVSDFEVGLSYNLGLKNISPYTGDGYKVNTRVLGISVGYKFGAK